MDGRHRALPVRRPRGDSFTSTDPSANCSSDPTAHRGPDCLARSNRHTQPDGVTRAHAYAFGFADRTNPGDAQPIAGAAAHAAAIWFAVSQQLAGQHQHIHHDRRAIHELPDDR